MGKHYNSKKRTRRLFRQMAELQDQLTDTALMLSQVITQRIAEGDAPLNQLSSTLGVVVDRMMKLDDYMRQSHATSESPASQSNPEIIVKYEYDGALTDTPPAGVSANFINFDPWRDGWGRPDYQPASQPESIPVQPEPGLIPNPSQPINHQADEPSPPKPTSESHHQPTRPPQPP